ncbi:MAG: hypothetical protein WCI03_14320 [bacterium]
MSILPAQQLFLGSLGEIEINRSNPTHGFDQSGARGSAEITATGLPAGIAGIPRPTPHPALDAQVQTAVKDLIRRAETRPRTMKTLRSTLHALFRKQLSEQELTALLDALCKEGMVKIDGLKVTYDFPSKAAIPASP